MTLSSIPLLLLLLTVAERDPNLSAGRTIHLTSVQYLQCFTPCMRQRGPLRPSLPGSRWLVASILYSIQPPSYHDRDRTPPTDHWLIRAIHLDEHLHSIKNLTTFLKNITFSSLCNISQPSTYTYPCSKASFRPAYAHTAARNFIYH